MSVGISMELKKGKVNVNFNTSLFPPRTERKSKGESMIAFPDSYCVVDIETSGLSPSYDDIIEISAIKISNNTIIDIFSSLLKPDCASSDNNYIDQFITDLTGITNEMLSEAPDTSVIIEKFSSFVCDSVIVAHNAHFDINFLYDNFMNYLNRPLTNNFIDTMRLFKRIHKELEHHRLSDMASFYNIEYTGAHRSLRDCEITQNCFCKMKEEFISLYGDADSFVKSYNSGTKTKAKDIHSTVTEFDESNLIYGKVVVFTGTLEKMTRKEAMQIVANLGGINGDGVTKKTNYLILGNNDYCSLIKDGKSNKQKKAEQLKLQGYDIEVIPESVFYDMLPE